MNLKKFFLYSITVLVLVNSVIAEETKMNDRQLNFFIGNFDFSDDKQKATLVGFQHQNVNLLLFHFNTGLKRVIQ